MSKTNEFIAKGTDMELTHFKRNVVIQYNARLTKFHRNFDTEFHGDLTLKSKEDAEPRLPTKHDVQNRIVMSTTTSQENQEPPPLRRVTAPTKFRITYTYVKSLDREVDNLLSEVAATEGLQISNFTVASVLETNRESLCIHYTQELDQLVAGYTDGVVRFYKGHTMELMHSLTDEDISENPAPVTNMKHRPPSKNYASTDTMICTYANGCVKCWNYNFCQCVYTIKEKRQTYGISYHPRLPKFVTCGDDSKIYMYDEENRVQERIFSGSNTPGVLDGHTSRVFAACFNPRSNHEFVTGGWDNVIQFWDIRQPFAVRHISGVHVCGDGLDINPKGTEVLSCAWQREKPLQLWDYGSGKLISTIEPDAYSAKLYCGKFIDKDYFVCGGTEPNILRLIESRNFHALGTINKLPGAIYSLAIGPNRKKQEARKSKNTTTAKLDFNLPRIAIVSGKKIYQLDM